MSVLALSWLHNSQQLARLCLAVARLIPQHCPWGCFAWVSGVAAGDLVSPEERSVLHTVGAAGLVAFVDVYDSLESAAK